MTWALIGLALFVGAFVGLLAGALAAAAHDGDAYERGWFDAVRKGTPR
jgi:uncharacterized membrane-anchored protein YhcB (DUF1043 family)